MPRWTEFHHRFGGRGQERGFAQSQRHKGQQHHPHAAPGQSGQGQQASPKGEAGQAQTQPDCHGALRQGLPHRPLEQQQQAQLDADQQGAHVLRLGGPFQAAPDQIQRQGALQECRDRGRHQRQAEQRQQWRQPELQRQAPFPMAAAAAWPRQGLPQQQQHQNRHGGHVHQIDAAQPAEAGQSGSCQGSCRHSGRIGAAHQRVAAGGGNGWGAERHRQLHRGPVQAPGHADQQLSGDVARQVMGPQQNRIATGTAQTCHQHRQAAAEAPIQQGATCEARHRAGQGRQRQAEPHGAGREVRLMEHHRREIEDAAGPEAGHQTDDRQLPQRRGKLEPPARALELRRWC